MKKGFSIIEIIIVLAVLGLIIGATLPEFSRIRENQVLKTAVTDILSSIDKARNETLSSLNSSEYGVRFEPSRVIIFKGQTYSLGASGNEIVPIALPANISRVTLGGSMSTTGDFYFNRLSGVPSKTGDINVTADSSTKVITITATGVASSN
jgi:prepilin-type N-terminal cleavage/methylation domain-containing protein